MIKNYKKPTPPKWRKIGDLALLLIPALMPIVAQSSLPDETKYWVGSILTIALIAVKFWTNTKA